jgi:hypothetical protein
LAAQVTVDWSLPQRGVAIALDPMNNVFTVDYEQNLGSDIVLTKVTDDGVHLWDAFYDQTSTTRFDQAAWVAADAQGNAVVCGTIKSGFSNPVNVNGVVMKFSGDGDLLWRQVLGTDFDGSSTRKCLVDLAGNAYVLGIGPGPGGLVTTVRKMGQDGSTTWQWSDEGIGAPLNIKFTPDSQLVVVHRATVGAANGYTRLDRDGQLLWNYSVPSLTAGDAAGDAQGNTIMVHAAANGVGTVVRKVDALGVLLWQEEFPITGFRVEVGSDGAAVVAGYPLNGSGGSAFLKVDATGQQQWVNQDADGPNNFLLHAQLMLDADDNAYLCAGTLFAMGICKVNANGSTAWYITAGSGGSQGFCRGSDDAVYVVGGHTVRLGQDLSTGLHVNVEHTHAAIVPNPAAEFIQCSWTGHRIAEWAIHSASSARVLAGRWTGAPIHIAELSPGVYLLTVIDVQGMRSTVRFVRD